MYRITGPNLSELPGSTSTNLKASITSPLRSGCRRSRPTSIDITPVPDGNVLDTVTVPTNNQLTIAPAPRPSVPASARSCSPGAGSSSAGHAQAAGAAARRTPANALRRLRAVPRASDDAAGNQPGPSCRTQAPGPPYGRVALPSPALTGERCLTLGSSGGCACYAAGVASAVTNAAGAPGAVTNAVRQATQTAPALVPSIIVSTSPPVVAPAAAPAAPRPRKPRQSLFSRLLHRSQ